MEINGEQRSFCVRLKSTQEKRARYLSHHEFLSGCLQKNVVPKGFQIKWTLGFDTNEEEKNTVSVILNNTSRQLLRQAVKVCERCIEETGKSEREIISGFRGRGNPGKYGQTYKFGQYHFKYNISNVNHATCKQTRSVYSRNICYCFISILIYAAANMTLMHMLKY